MVRLSWVLLAGSTFAACAHRPARWVDDLKLTGNRAVSDKEIKTGLATQESSWWPFSARRPFDAAALEIDRRRVERIYAERGYFEVRVEPPVVEEEESGRVDVRISIEEGPPTQIREVRLQGLPELEPAELRRLRSRLELDRGSRFDQRRYAAAKRKLQAFLVERGHAYATVSGEVWVARQARAADIILRVDAGPEVKLGELAVDGAGVIPAWPLWIERPWSAGEIYRPQRLDLFRQRLNAMGVFSSVSVRLPHPPEAEPTVQVRVTPARLRRVRVGGGVGLERRRQEVRLLAEWSHRNFLGGLRAMRMQLKPALVAIPAAWDLERSGVAFESDLELRQPYLFGTRLEASAAVGYDLGVHEGYRFHGPRTALTLSRPFLGDLLRVGISWNLQFLMFFDFNQAVFDPLTTPLGLGFRDPYRVAWIEQWSVLDWRDQPIDARRGIYFELRLEEGLPEVASDFRYFKITPDLRGYLPLGRRLTIAGRAMLGWLRPLGGDDSPITRRYSLGGPGSHRGFSFGRLAPQVPEPGSDRRIPLGGNGALLLSAELRLRLFQLFGMWLNLVPFLDAGDVVARLEELELGALHLASGASLAYETPIGSLRLGLGVRLNRLEGLGPGGRPNPDPGERIAFHITLGAAF